MRRIPQERRIRVKLNAEGSRLAIASRVRPRPWPPSRFLRQQIRSADGAAALHYPAPSRGSDPRTGAGAHTDYGNLTLLATDDVGGLEVRGRAGQWIEAPVIPGAFIVNIGDCLMRWTNDVYVSTPHRVVNRSARERYSIAFPRSESGRDGRSDFELRGAGRGRALSADAGRRLSDNAPRREQASGSGSGERPAVSLKRLSLVRAILLIGGFAPRLP